MKHFRWLLGFILLVMTSSVLAIQGYVLPTVTTGFPITMTGTCSYTFESSPGAQPCTYTASTATFNFTDSSTPTAKSCIVNLGAAGNVLASTTCNATNSGGTIIVSGFTPPPPPGVQVYISQGNALSFPVTVTGGCPGSFSSSTAGAISCSISAVTTTSTLTDSNGKTCALVMRKSGNTVTLDPSTTCIAISSGGATPTFIVTGMFASMPIYLNPTVMGDFPISVTGACTVSLPNANAVACNVPLSTTPVTLTLSDASQNTCALVLDNGPGGVQIDPASTCQATSTVSVPATINITSLTPLPGCAGISNGYCKSARYGDYLSAQMKSTRKFGYGMFVVKMKAADGPTCSTFWLYSDAPAPGAAPEIAQLWRWNEFDVEFVPYTQATQNAYVLYNTSGFGHTYYGSTLNWSAMTSGQILPSLVQWVEGKVMTDDAVFADMQKYYNLWMVAQNPNNNPDNQIPANLMNFAGAVQTTGPGFSVGGIAPNAGWNQASIWKYPLTAVTTSPPQAATPAGSPLQMVALNWWRMPTGNSTIPVTLPGVGTPYNYSYIFKLAGLDGSSAVTSSTAMSLNNETYVFPGTGTFTPYDTLNTFTIVWTPTRVAYYINVGTDIDGAIPVIEYKNTTTNPDFPSMAASGTQAPQGTVTWADTSLADQLGEVSINLANYVAFQAAAGVPNSQLNCTTNPYSGSGWSGTPPKTDFTSATAYFRSVQYYQYAGSGDGQHASDFSKTPTWGFDLSDGTWNADTFQTNISKYFGILYSQDATSSGGGSTFPLRDAKSPLAVSFVLNADGSIAKDKNPLMALTVTPSQVSPKRNFFVIKTTMSTGVPVSASNPFMFLTYTPQGGSSIGVSGVSTPLSFFAPAIPTTNGTPCTSPYTGKAGTCNATTGTINLYMSKTYHAAFPSGRVPTSPDATATITLYTDSYGYIWWAPLSDPMGILAVFQAQNPQSITVQPGSATPGS